MKAHLSVVELKIELFGVIIIKNKKKNVNYVVLCLHFNEADFLLS